MKKFAFALMALCSFAVVSLGGCNGSGDTAVIEAPAENEPDVSEIDPEAYERSMNESMSQPEN